MSNALCISLIAIAFTIVPRVGAMGTLEISLHMQVNRFAVLSTAHAIASAIEESIKCQLKDAGNVKVHLEPAIPEAAGIEPVSQAEMQESTKSIVLEPSDIKKVSR